MEQFWQFLVITDLKATERSKNTHSSQNMSDLGKCRVVFKKGVQTFFKKMQLFKKDFRHSLLVENHDDKALHDRIGSRSNDDLDHILGKKDRNWLHF